MKLTATAQVSVDGVMQGPGAPVPGIVEGGGFDRDGWAHFDVEAGTAMDAIFRRADAFLFGRRTYEVFAASWGTWDDPGNSPIWTALHTKPKYVATSTMTNAPWSDTIAVSDDVRVAVRELKAQSGGELQLHASGALFRSLNEAGLVDELTLFTFPVVVGQGARLFPDTGPRMALDLLSSGSTTTGITIQVYRPSGFGRPGQSRAGQSIGE